jgi:hypothetical protein
MPAILRTTLGAIQPQSLSGRVFEIVAAQIYIHFVVNPPVRWGYRPGSAKILLATISGLLLESLTGRHPAPQPLIYPVIRNKFSPSLMGQPFLYWLTRTWANVIIFW